MNIEIRITGSGSDKKVVAELRQIAEDIELGNHINSLKEVGELTWEDATLLTEISEDSL